MAKFSSISNLYVSFVDVACSKSKKYLKGICLTDPTPTFQTYVPHVHIITFCVGGYDLVSVLLSCSHIYFKFGKKLYFGTM